MSKPSTEIADRYYLILVVLVLAVAGFNFFAWLGKPPVADWDEARHGVTAYEMIRNGDFLVTTYLNNPDYWGLKPPLGVWLIALSYRIFGYSVFSLRFFSAFFGLLSVFLTMRIAKRHYGPAVSVLSGMILSTTYGFVLIHSGRTGDWDSALAFFTVLFVFFLDRTEERTVYFYLAGLTAAFAFLLKSFASTPLLVMAVLYILARRRSINLRLKHFLLFTASFVVPVCLWAAARYSRDGLTFLKAMTGDLLNRSAHAIEGHTGGPAFYLVGMSRTFSPWWLVTGVFLVILAGAFFAGKNKTARDGTASKPDCSHFPGPLIVWIWLFIPLGIFSMAETKLLWYINPVYPALAILSASVLVGAAAALNTENRRPFRRIGTFLIVIILCSLAVAETGIVNGITEDAKSIDGAQNLLINLPQDAAGPGARLFLSGRAAQSQVFVAEVLKNLEVSSLSRTEFEAVKRAAQSVARVLASYKFDVLRAKHFEPLKRAWSVSKMLGDLKPGSLSREKFESFKKAVDADNMLLIEMVTRRRVAPDRKNLLLLVRPGDLVLMSETRGNMDFLRMNGFSPLRENGGWVIARKNGRRQGN